MSKSNSIEKKADAALAVATPSESYIAKRAAAAKAAGMETVRIGTLHLHQGSGKEDMTYGQHPKGSWIDELTGEVVPAETRVIPVHCNSYRGVWWRYDSKKGEGYPLALFDHGQPKPQSDRDGNPIPWEDPDIEVKDHLDLFLLIGDDPLPRLYRAKSTSLRAVQSMNTLERSRIAGGRPGGAYRLSTQQKSNDENQWFIPHFIADGDQTKAEMVAWEAAFDLVPSGQFEVSREGDAPAQRPAAQATNAETVSADDIPF